MINIRWRIGRVELAERPVQEWAEQMRERGARVRVVRRQVSALGAQRRLWVAVVGEEEVVPDET